MLVQTEEDKVLIQLPPSQTRSTGLYKSNPESKAELKRTEEKLHIQWPVIKASKSAVDWTLGLYQHGQQPKFSHKGFHTSHKEPSTLPPKRREQHDDSPGMLKPPTSTVMKQVPDSEITKCSSWLEAFAARTSHSASLSFTALEASSSCSCLLLPRGWLTRLRLRWT